MGAIKAGHNLLMPGYLKQIKYIYEKMQDGTLLRSEIERCVTDLLKMIMKTRSSLVPNVTSWTPYKRCEHHRFLSFL